MDTDAGQQPLLEAHSITRTLLLTSAILESSLQLVSMETGTSTEHQFCNTSGQAARQVGIKPYPPCPRTCPPEPSHQWTCTSPRTPRASVPPMAGQHQPWETPGLGPLHQQANTSPRTHKPQDSAPLSSKPTPVFGLPGLRRQLCQEQAPHQQAISQIRDTQPCNHPSQDLAPPINGLALAPEPLRALYPAALEPSLTHQWLAASAQATNQYGLVYSYLYCYIYRVAISFSRASS